LNSKLDEILHLQPIRIDLQDGIFSSPETLLYGYLN